MADAHGLGPCVLIGRGGSTPLPGTVLLTCQKDMGHEIPFDISLLDLPISPYQARCFLKRLSIACEEWNGLMSEKHGHHSIQALIRIAQGDKPQSWARVCRSLREKS